MLYLHLLKREFINILLIKSKVNMKNKQTDISSGCNLVVAYYSVLCWIIRLIQTV